MILQSISNNTELFRLTHIIGRRIWAFIEKIFNLKVSRLIKLRLFIEALDHLRAAWWSLCCRVMNAEFTVPIYFTHILTHTCRERHRLTKKTEAILSEKGSGLIGNSWLLNLGKTLSEHTVLLRGDTEACWFLFDWHLTWELHWHLRLNFGIKVNLS
jgi:hypothetical protein